MNARLLFKFYYLTIHYPKHIRTGLAINLSISPYRSQQFNPEQPGRREKRALTRIIHEASTAAADPGMSTALRLVGFLDVL
jgi:hypothetical protein